MADVPSVPTHYAAMARDSLGHVLESLLAELLEVAARISNGQYQTQEGIIADGARLCDVAQSIHACVRVRAMMIRRLEADR